jgi:hypothetical protein
MVGYSQEYTEELEFREKCVKALEYEVERVLKKLAGTRLTYALRRDNKKHPDFLEAIKWMADNQFFVKNVLDNYKEDPEHADVLVAREVWFRGQKVKTILIKIPKDEPDTDSRETEER